MKDQKKRSPKNILDGEAKSKIFSWVHTASTCTDLLLWIEVPEIRINAIDSAVYVSSSASLSAINFLYPELNPP